MDVVLRHQGDGHTIPPYRKFKLNHSATSREHLWINVPLKLRAWCLKFTCSCRSSDSVDVDLGNAGGVVVNDHLDSWNIQTPFEPKTEVRLKSWSAFTKATL